MVEEKVLYIGRHAKSSWDFPGRADIDRPLAERGLNDAYDMAGRLKKRGHTPGYIISSPANRALHTAIIFARELKVPLSRLEINEDLYMAGEDAVLQAVAGANDSYGSLMVFGHNPDFTYLANHFLQEHLYNIPTCGVVRLVFSVNQWQDIHRGKLMDYSFDYPKKK